VKPDVHAAVSAAIEQIGYVPNRAARALVTRRTDAVAVVISAAGGDTDEDQAVREIFGDPFFGRIATAAVRTLRAHNVHPLLMMADSQRARLQTLDFLTNGGVDGVLLVSTHKDDPMPVMIANSGVPAVAFARPATPVALSYVDVSGSDGGAIAAERLLERGCTQLGVIGASGDLAMPSIFDRITGFQDRAAREGIAFVPRVDGDLMRESGAVAARKLFDQHPGVDGLFVVNDTMASGVLDVCRERGMRVPQDVAVVGFDDSSIAVQCSPALTTISQPREEMARAMGDLLMRRIGDPQLPPASVVLAPSLVARDSA
jgi:DNA-binding LacI/PurR family transcriptional regulator